MTEHDGRKWAIVGALFATLFLIWGPVNASSVFFIPVVNHFGWSRGFFSLLVASAPLAAGLSSPVVGRLLDRVSAHKTMIVGASMVALSYLGLSRATTAGEFLLIFIVLGVGISASTIIPTALVITRRFRENRGLALGIAFSGIPLGGSGISLFANYIVLHHGFRAGYLAMALPIILIVLPLVTLLVRTRPVPAGETTQNAATKSSPLPGLELREAFRTRSFWMVALADLLFAAAAAGIRVHPVPYLTDLAYSPTLAAEAFAAMFMFSAIGSFAVGSFADRFGGRAMLVAAFAVSAAGIAILVGAAHFVSLAAFVVVFGLTRETTPVLVPLTIGESLGVRGLGSILGIVALCTTIGFAAGPAIAGRIFDVTGSYSGALGLFATLASIAALAIRASLPLAEESLRIAVERPAVA